MGAAHRVRRDRDGKTTPQKRRGIRTDDGKPETVHPDPSRGAHFAAPTQLLYPSYSRGQPGSSAFEARWETRWPEGGVGRSYTVDRITLQELERQSLAELIMLS